MRVIARIIISVLLGMPISQSLLVCSDSSSGDAPLLLKSIMFLPWVAAVSSGDAHHPNMVVGNAVLHLLVTGIIFVVLTVGGRLLRRRA